MMETEQGTYQSLFMTADEFEAWVPREEWGRWELIDGKPRPRFLRWLRPWEIVATTPEELYRYLETRKTSDLNDGGSSPD